MHKNNSKNIITIGTDGFLKIFDLNTKSILKQFKISEFCLSSFVCLK